MILSLAVGTLAGLSFLLTVWQWVGARRFPLHQRRASSLTPAVTVLKPLKGTDAELEACLRSWLDQDYAGQVQILFGVAFAEDPVCDLVRKLLADYPEADAQLVLCPKILGPNAKVSSLVHLQALAKHPVIVISDADVHAPADLLENVAPMLEDPKVGLVNCFYRLGKVVTAAMEWEAVAVNSDFWSQVLQSRALKPLDFALGAVMATTQARLKAIGGFSALLDYLADDYQLGHKIKAAGGLIELCPVVVECRSEPMGWREVWIHQLRWTRTIRVCQPVPFFFSILSNATLWPSLWVLADRTAVSGVGAVFCGLFRVWTAASQQRRLTGRWPGGRSLALVIAKDLLGFLIWALALVGNTIVWRGDRYRMLRDGRLAGPL